MAFAHLASPSEVPDPLDDDLEPLELPPLDDHGTADWTPAGVDAEHAPTAHDRNSSADDGEESESLYDLDMAVAGDEVFDPREGLDVDDDAESTRWSHDSESAAELELGDDAVGDVEHGWTQGNDTTEDDGWIDDWIEGDDGRAEAPDAGEVGLDDPTLPHDGTEDDIDLPPLDADDAEGSYDLEV